MKLERDDIALLADGAWLLGTGGGGSPYHARLNLERLYDAGAAPVSIVPASSLDDDAAVAVVSNMGAPLVGLERLLDPEPMLRAVDAIVTCTGVTFDAVMAIEIGGNNGLAPFLVASQLGLPVVDADAMGRAYPEAQMTSFAIGELNPVPLALADCRDNEVVITGVESWRWLERLARNVCTEMGSRAATCKAPRTGLEVKEWGIHGTVSQALGLGRAVAAARAAHADPVAAVLAEGRGVSLFAGKVVDVDRVTTGGFLRGVATIADGAGRTLTLDFQNEWIVARIDGEPVATTPDLLCLLDADTGEAVGTEVVRYGQRVACVVLPAPEILRSPKGLAVVGPRAFGYDIEYRSVFEVGVA